MNNPTLKSIWAVLAGVLATIIVTALVDIMLHVAKGLSGLGRAAHRRVVPAREFLPSRDRHRCRLSYGETRAQPADVRHALILGWVGTVLGLIGVVTTWDKGLGPHWYPARSPVCSRSRSAGPAANSTNGNRHARAA